MSGKEVHRSRLTFDPRQPPEDEPRGDVYAAVHVWITGTDQDQQAGGPTSYVPG
jgi:hypothetical protein